MKDSNIVIAATFRLPSCSLIPVLKETANSHSPIVPIKSTQNIIKLFHSEEEPVLVTLLHKHPMNRSHLVEDTAIKKDEQSTLAPAWLINLAHAVKLQCYSNTTDFRKARHCSIQRWNLGHPPTALQTTAAADSPMHIPAIPRT